MAKKTKAKIEDIKRLAKKIKDNWSLCQFAQDTGTGCEIEYLIAETVHACVLNHKEHGEPFSFNKIKYSTSLCNNFSAFDWLVENGLFIDTKRKGKRIIVLTQHCIDRLDEFFNKKTKSPE